MAGCGKHLFLKNPLVAFFHDGGYSMYKDN